jgi:hypothetical protein
MPEGNGDTQTIPVMKSEVYTVFGKNLGVAKGLKLFVIELANSHIN